MPAVREIKDRPAWETFNLRQQFPQFLQSWNASCQEERLGHEVLRLGVFEEDQLKGLALVIKHKARRGKYFFVPYGPVIDWQQPRYFATLIEHIKDIGDREGADFIRVCPFIDDNNYNQQLFNDHGFKIAPLQTIAENIWLLDLSPDNDQLLMGMRKTMRNQIRRAQKEHVIIKKEDSVENFIDLHKYTVAKHHFNPYPNKLFKEQLAAFKDDNQVQVFTAYYQEKPLASAIIMYYGTMASYHHGSSIPSKVPVTYLLQWEASLEAKRRGCKHYNFWGIYPDNNPKLAGVSKFKTGFGGWQKDLLPAQDLPLTYKYKMNYFIEVLRRKKRGFTKR